MSAVALCGFSILYAAVYVPSGNGCRGLWYTEVERTIFIDNKVIKGNIGDSIMFLCMP